MTPQANKNITNQLVKTYVERQESDSFMNEISSLNETQDLIFLLNQNLNSITQAEKRLSFMIGEVRSTIKKRI